MIKLGQTTTGISKGIKYMWLVKDMGIYSKTECYVVMGFNGNGWFSMFNGTLKDCRSFIGNEVVVNI